jgi:hypothetical protein
MKPPNPKFQIGDTLTVLDQFGTTSPNQGEPTLYIGDTVEVKDVFQLDNQPDVNIYRCEKNGYRYDIREDLAASDVPLKTKIIFNYGSRKKDETNFEVRFYDSVDSISTDCSGNYNESKYIKLTTAIRTAVLHPYDKLIVVDVIKFDKNAEVIHQIVVDALNSVEGLVVKKLTPDGKQVNVYMVMFRNTKEPWNLELQIDGEKVEVES